MKKLLISLIALVGLSVSGLAFANGKALGIAGSPHDFSDNVCGGYDTTLTVGDGTAFDSTDGCGTVVETGTGGWNQRGEICRTCHVPHDHQLTTNYYTVGLLWNHAVSAATYTMYDSPTMEAFGSPPTGPDGSSVLCLGCHDGTVAVDTFDKYDPLGTSTNKIGQAADAFYATGYKVGVGTTNPVLMTGTHPISMDYDVGDPGLNTLASSMNTSGTIDDVLQDGKVQCSSCHDVHDAIGKAVADTHLLRDGNTAGTSSTGEPSQLCLNCHKK